MTTPERPEKGPLILARPNPGETKEEFKARLREMFREAGIFPDAPQGDSSPS